MHTGRRWYLLAWDVDRDDWRTFRLDRVAQPYGTGRRFRPRAAPDAAEYVHQSISTRPYRHQVRVRLRAPLAEIAERVPPEAAILTEAGETSCDLAAASDSMDLLAVHIAALDVDFEVLDPPEFAERMAVLGRRLINSGLQVVRAGSDHLDAAADLDRAVRSGADENQ